MNKDFVYKRRLLKLADYGDTIPLKRFKFDVFAGVNWAGKPDLSCGAGACMLGHSTTIPSFQRLGLYMYRGKNSNSPMVGLKGGRTGPLGVQDVGRKIFGLEEAELDLLFIPSDHLIAESVMDLYHQEEHFGFTSLPSDSTAQQVSVQIRRFVEWKYGPSAI
jgi:hypothetical protein